MKNMTMINPMKNEITANILTQLGKIANLAGRLARDPVLDISCAKTCIERIGWRTTSSGDLFDTSTRPGLRDHLSDTGALLGIDCDCEILIAWSKNNQDMINLVGEIQGWVHDELDRRIPQ